MEYYIVVFESGERVVIGGQHVVDLAVALRVNLDEIENCNEWVQPGTMVPEYGEVKGCWAPSSQPSAMSVAYELAHELDMDVADAFVSQAHDDGLISEACALEWFGM